MPKKIPFLFLLLSGLMLSVATRATHLRAGEITIQRVSCSSLSFEITITVYIDTETGVQFGGPEDWLDFGDGTRLLIPMQATRPRPDLGQNMGMVTYTVNHVYPAPGVYLVSYSEPNRNNHIVNLNNGNSDQILFVVQTEFLVDPSLSCNKYLPVLGAPPIDRACVGVAFFHNPAASDLDGGDSLSYELVVPMFGRETPVVSYRDPTDRKFYLDYENGNETKNGIPSFSINPSTGDLKWDAPGAAGEYNIAFRIIEWAKDRFGNWHRIGYVTRDMQIIVEDCNNDRPDLIIPNDTCVVAGTTLRETIFGTDPEDQPVIIEVFSEALRVLVSPATFNPRPPKFQPSSPAARLEFEWRTSCEHVRDQYYQVVFKITDNPPRGPRLVTFKTWRIKVVAPPPNWRDARPDPGKRTATLQWDEYICGNASQMQVWRKIEGDPYIPSHCETGMPDLGYSLVATVGLKDPDTSQPVTRFTDTNNGKGLAPGAAYCYRLVAVFPLPMGGESYVSRDICLTPIFADAPVITNVTVEKTHPENGAVRVNWYAPFEIDRSQFPGPYEYAVYRANGFDGNDAIRITPESRIRDTTFVDDGIDTEGGIFNYRIVLYSNTVSDPASWMPVDTSAVASSVRLEPRVLPDRVALTWNADVPWLNTSDRFPYHLVFRGTSDDPQNFILIDSVKSSGGFAYNDRGQYNSMPLDKTQKYCYRVLTRGVYGNAAIREPLENFSQVVCVVPDADGKPCAPSLSLNTIDCDALFATSQCLVRDFSNRIHWQVACESQVHSFRVYASSSPDGDFTLIADKVKGDSYVDRNLSSFARCYKVTSVDGQGIESEFSEIVCNDNCPYFALPNVFTPNGDDCNEYFSAYGPFNPLNQHAPESCVPGYDNYAQCERFVKKVNFQVFNRWGKEVYTFRSGGERSIYINWEGRDNDGQWLSTGIYYYVANVTFDVLDPGKQQQTLKGWVQLVR